MEDERHILLAYKGSTADQAALRLVCRLAKSIRARVTLVHVLEVPLSYEVDALDIPGLDDAEQKLEEAEKIARKLGIDLHSDMIQAREAGMAIVGEAEEIAADLLVVTDGRRHRPLERPIGSTIRYLFQRAPCPVCTIYPADEKAAF